jgi:hypothetical protein
LRKIILALICLPLLCGVRGGLTTSTTLPNTPLTVMNLGSGGNISGQSLISGARLVRGDVFGAYIFGTDNTWHLINGESNMCPGGYPSAQNCHFGYFPANTSANQVYVGFKGIIELVGCPNVASCAYMYGGDSNSCGNLSLCGANVFYSGNIDPAHPTAISWCHTNFTPTSGTSNSANSASPFDPSPMMAVDPNNPDHVLVGTATTGIFESFNATSACSGTDTWTAISTSSIPQGSAYPGYLVAFDLTAPTMTCHIGSGTCTSTYYVYTNGAPTGIYATFDSGTTWTAISSAASPPTTPISHIKVSAATAGGGNLWVAGGSGTKLWEYNSSVGTPCSTGLGTCAFHQITGTGLASGNDVAINPLNGNQVGSIGPGGKMSVSTNGASAVPTFASGFTASPTAGDTPWTLGTVAGTQFFGINGFDFDPLNNGTLLGHGSQWEYTTTFPSGNYTWAALSSGIQGAVSFGNIQVAATQSPTFAYEDITGCTFSISTAATPPSGCALPSQGSNGLYEYAGLSVAPGTTTMFSAGQEDTGVSFSLSGYSTDGFKTNYLPYNQWNASVNGSTGVTTGASSAVRLNVGSTALLNSFTPGDTLSRNSIVCIVTTIFTSTLSQNCWPINVIDGSHIDLIGSTVNLGLMAVAGTYTAYVPANVLSDWFGDGTVTNVVSGAGGLVQVTYFNQIATPVHAPICISGVVMTGATVVNGCWVANNVSSTITLQGSTFVGGDTYSTGGTVLSTMVEQSVAASTTTNLAIYGGDSSPAYCTTNAGANWNQINITGVPASTATVTGGPYAAGTTSITITTGAGWNLNKPTLLLHSGRVLNEVSSTLSGSTLTLHIAIPPGDSLDNGAPIYGQESLGGPFAAFFRSHQIDVDQVTPNTFFYMNAVAGLVKWTNCGSTTVVATPSVPSFLNSAGDGDQLKTVPGEAGHLFYTAGPVGAVGLSNHPAQNLLWRTCNGVNNAANSVTVSQVPGFFEPLAVGFGKVAPGHSYPSIYVVGWYSTTNNRNNAAYGIWLSVDDANNASTGTCATGNTWTEISGTGGMPAGFPNGSILDITGDPFTYGPYYVFGGFGQFYGIQN